VIVLLFTAALSGLFLLPPDQAFLRTWHVFPVLVWAALAFELRGATIAVSIVAIAAIWAADQGLGPMTAMAFIGTGQISLVQQFIAITALTILALAVVADERRAKNGLADRGRLLRLAEEEARARAEELEVVLAAAPVAIWVARDSECKEIIGNATSARLLRLPGPEENMSKSVGENPAVGHFTIFDAMGHELAPHELPVQRAAQGELVNDFEERIVFADGSAISLLGNATPLFSKDGQLRGAVAAFIDITERKAAESREHLLAREVDHRAKNIMAVIQAIVQLTEADGIANFRKAISGRIGSLARSHTILADNRWDGAELRELIEEELAPYLPHQTAASRRVVLAGPRLKLNPMAAQSIALIIHELITNALKHGSLSQAEGQLRVEWQVEPSASKQRFILHWIERGGPTIAAPGTAGFGLSLIETMARDQLYGSIEPAWNPEGLTVKLTIPVGDLFLAPTFA
jgi:two-component sensor histidine kinase/PAS domain-containing protein